MLTSNLAARIKCQGQTSPRWGQAAA